jgi:flagellar biosynthesis regulator FlbT
MLKALAEVMATLQSPVAKAAAARFARLVAMSDHYRALVDCRALIEMERTAEMRPADDYSVPPNVTH